MPHHTHRHFVPSGDLIFNINEIIQVVEAKIKPPIGYWTFDDTPNSSINNITGTWTGTPVYTTSPIGKSFTGDATKYITMDKENLFDFDVGDAMSLVLWVKHTDASSDGLICKNDIKFAGLGWALGTRSADFKLRFNIEDGAGFGIDVIEGTTVLNDGIWHHIVMSKTASTDYTSVTFYIDGEVGSTLLVQNNFTGSALNNVPVVIGAESDGGSPFNGDIDDVAIFDYALTSDQVKSIYLSSAGHALSNPQKILKILQNITTDVVGLVTPALTQKVLGILKTVTTSIVGLIESPNLGIRKTLSSIVGLIENKSIGYRINLPDIVGLVESIGIGYRINLSSIIELTDGTPIKIIGLLRNTATSIVGLISSVNLGIRKTVGDIVGINTIQNRLGTWLRNIPDTVGLNELKNLGMRINIPDIVGLNEISQKVGGILRVVPTDIVGLLEDIARARIMVRNVLVDIVLLLENAQAGFSLKETVNDIVGILEGVFLGKRRNILDIVAVTESKNLGLRKSISDLIAITEIKTMAANWVRWANDVVGVVESSQLLFVGIIKEGVDLFNRAANIILPTRGGRVMFFNRGISTHTFDRSKVISLQSMGKGISPSTSSGSLRTSNRTGSPRLADRGKNTNIQSGKSGKSKLQDRSKSPKLYNREIDVDSMVEND